MATANVIPTAPSKTKFRIVCVGSDDARSKYIKVCSEIIWMRYTKYDIFPIRKQWGASKPAGEQVAIAMGRQRC